MKPQNGYYSLIQYCPDRGRAEAANVGVLVFCPKTGFIDAVVSKSNRRLERVFGRGSFDPWWIRNAKRAVVAGIRHERERFKTLADLEQFIATRGNELIFTSPRAMRIEDAEADLRNLFTELVGERRDESLSGAASLLPQLHDVFHRLTRQKTSVRVGWTYDVPEYSHRVRADYYYENGRANLVRMLPIGNQPSRVFSAAVRLGGESVFVDKHLRPNNKPASLIIIAAQERAGHDGEVETRLEELYRDYPATLIRSNQVESFAKTVEDEAH